jgi:hypothetical protein
LQQLVFGLVLKEAPVTIPSKTPLLDTIAAPSDLRRLNESDLAQVADELRSEAISGRD